MATQRSRSEKSAIRAAAGMMAEVWLALDRAVRERGGDDDAVAQLTTNKGQHLIGPIADLLVNTVAVPIMQVGWHLVLTWIIGVCRFVTYVDPNITADNFPFQLGDLTIKEVIKVAIPVAMSTQDVLKFLDNRGLRPATLVELLWWWLTHPAEQSNCMVVALGSVWDGNAPFVGGDGAHRCLALGTVALDCSAPCAFAAVRK